MKGIALLILIFLLIPTSCNGGQMNEKAVSYEKLSDVPDSDWEKFLLKKIYFGHQSVGNNIIDGIKHFSNQNSSITLNITETTDSTDFTEGIFAHSIVGENTNPQSKIDSFVQNIRNGIGKKADAVGLKFCYIDFAPHTDYQKVFNNYKQAVDTLKKEFSTLKIYHFTLPLTDIQSGPKAWIKKVLGKPQAGIHDNIVRYKYNELLIKEYTGVDPIFDLSKAQSTYSDGRRSTYSMDGITYYSLISDYTYDGGHLNEKGKKVVAEQFLLFLIMNI